MSAELELLLLAHMLAGLNFGLGSMILAIPFRREWRIWGVRLLYDGVLTEIAVSIVYGVQILKSYVESLLYLGLSQQPSPASYKTIFNLLSEIHANLVSLTTAVSSVDAASADLLARSLGHISSLITSSIVVWSTFDAVSKIIPSMWLTVWVFGIVAFSLPFRAGTRLGVMCMSSSFVLSIALPLTPAFALSLVQGLGTDISPLSRLVQNVVENPSSYPDALLMLPSLIGSVMASVILALAVFPFVYLTLLTLIIRQIAALLGGRGVRSFYGIIPIGLLT